MPPSLSHFLIFRLGYLMYKYMPLFIPFRQRVSKLTLLAVNSTRQVTDTEVLEFYNLATSKILTGLEVC